MRKCFLMAVAAVMLMTQFANAGLLDRLRARRAGRTTAPNATAAATADGSGKATAPSSTPPAPAPAPTTSVAPAPAPAASTAPPAKQTAPANNK